MGMLERMRDPRVAGVALPVLPSRLPLGLLTGLLLSWIRRRNCSLFMVSGQEAGGNLPGFVEGKKESDRAKSGTDNIEMQKSQSIMLNK